MIQGINLIFGIILAFCSHPLHVSFTNLEFNSSVERWEVSVKLFKDDFADDLKNMYAFETVISDEEKPGEKEYFQRYVEDCLNISFNNESIDVGSWNYEGRKVNFEAVWLNFSFEFDGLLKNVSIENRLMFDLFSDQKNLLIFTYLGEQRAYQFRHNKPDIEFSL